MARRKKGNPVHGWVVLDKHAGLTSTQAVAAVRRLFDAQKAGHAGTLDPLASGVLPIALGEATKTVSFTVDGAKAYQFTIQWGVETDTDDAEGKLVRRVRSGPMPRRSPGCCLTSLARLRKFPRVFPPSSSLVSGPMTWRERAKQFLSSRGWSRSPGSSSSTAPVRTEPCSRRSAARAPTCARSPETWAARSAATAMSWSCAAHVSACSAPQRLLPSIGCRNSRVKARSAKSLLPVAAALGGVPALNLSTSDATRLRHGRAVLLRGRDAPILSGSAYATCRGELVAIGEIDKGELRPTRVFNWS